MRTIRIALLVISLAVALAGIGASNAVAAFGIEPGSFDGIELDQGGHAFTRAGGHPYSFTSGFSLNSVPISEPGEEHGLPKSQESNLRHVTVELPPGFVGNPNATPKCSLADFAREARECPDSTQVGVSHAFVNLFGVHGDIAGAIYNLQPPSGVPAEFGFWTGPVPTTMKPSIRSDGDYGLNANFDNIDDTLRLTAANLEFWGIPASPLHDMQRGYLPANTCNDTGLAPPCPSAAPRLAFLTNPTDCAHGPFTLNAEVDGWGGQTDSASFVTHDEEGNPVGVTECERVPFQPSMESSVTTSTAETASGLDFQLDLPDDGIIGPEAIAQANLKKAVVKLPEGVTVNPSSAEGLDVCSQADFARETLESAPGAGCPSASKIGTVRIDTPLLDPGEYLEGSLYIAKPLENPFGSLLALYMVARVPERGVIVKLAGKIDTDPRTGQVTTTFENLPQLPFSAFGLHLREGGRAPLVSPSTCGEMVTEANLTPWSSNSPGDVARLNSVSQINQGVGGGSCPVGGLPPFHPGLIAGTLNNAAGRFSPFNLRLFRSDEEQEITHFSIKLPPGITAKLAGVPYCSDAAIAIAKSREHLAGGKEEQAGPSCPATSEIGHTLVGAGVGSVLTYVPGKVYLAGPYHGSPLSVVAITSGVVGPFDIGTVVVREALNINPETGEVFIDATGSDPIPHIVDGITTHIRDIRTYVDKPEFTLNPTDCDRTQTASTVLGAGLNFVSEADDNPITVATPFQAADCAALPFEPKLSLRLIGGTKRGAHPKFRAHLKMNGIGEAAIERAQVTLPRSEFLENAHIKTICTRVQFKAGGGNGAGCPAGSVYGHAKAVTPILSEPLEGPVFLRSSEHQLPDLVAALHTQSGIDIDLVGRVDSVKGGIRNTFEAAPDAPVSEFTLTMQGAGKGLLVNSADICKGRHRAIVNFTAHNGKVSDSKPALQAKCHKPRKAK